MIKSHSQLKEIIITPSKSKIANGGLHRQKFEDQKINGINLQGKKKTKSSQNYQKEHAEDNDKKVQATQRHNTCRTNMQSSATIREM